MDSQTEASIQGRPDASMKWILVALAVIGLILIALFAWANNDENMPPIYLALPLGALGACLREFQMTLRGESAARGIPFFGSNSLVATWTRIIVGALLAVVLVGVFVSGMLKGHLFPEFTFKDSTFTNFKELLRGVSFSQNHDAVKALVWSIIAGYSEDWVLTILAGAKPADKA